MATFRKNHVRKSGKESGGMIAKVGLFSLILGALWFGFQKLGGSASPKAPPEEPIAEDVQNMEETPKDSIFYLPVGGGEVVRHRHYALAWNEKYEVADWVAYELTADRLNLQWVERSNNFRPDPSISSGSSTPDDYRNTRFDRGHLVPAADMAFSEEAMSETFFMSNISPQDPGFNKGIWRELEELTRDWAKRFRHLYVLSGPVYNQKIKFWVGENQVAVPPAFFRVLLDLNEPEVKAIAYLIPNEVSSERIESFATTIDEIENLTGLDFFSNLLEDDLEEKLESSFDANLWKTNEKKYQLRLEKWNQQE
jgi:endonuclease G